MIEFRIKQFCIISKHGVKFAENRLTSFASSSHIESSSEIPYQGLLKRQLKPADYSQRRRYLEWVDEQFF